MEWVIRTPYLTAIAPMPDLASHSASQRIVAELRSSPEKILPMLDRMKRVNLGGYFEVLVHYWLDQLPDVDVIEHNLQIWKEKQTVGELDLVFRYKDVVYHWELSIKLYANLGDPLDEANWIGPLKKDTLARKFSRLFEHQLTLPKTTAGSDALKQLGLQSASIQSYSFVKGCLFRESTGDAGQIAFPRSVNPKCLLQSWSDVADFQFPETTTHYAILPKLRWMSGPVADEWQKLSASDALADIEKAIEVAARPLLVAFAARKNQSEDFTEISRNFIMPAGWRSDPVLVKGS